ncbi:MAG: FAD-binding oxidoreductase [Shinella sp.]|nr:FAD-binding oxidoreductase [Shinella sp.]
MDDRARSFIESSTLMFIASRNAAGAMDVSPRGGQPAVMRLSDDGRLLLPDYLGNRRLDTIGNVLANPEVALILLNRSTDAYLRIRARAEVSRDDDDLAAFPADENPPLSVMVLTPLSMEFVESPAFSAAGFWVGAEGRKPPLDLGEIYETDKKWQAAGGRGPVMRDAQGEQALAESGLREFYGTPSIPVQTKVYRAAGPGFMGFMDKACFIVFGREDDDGGIALDLVGGQTLRPDPAANTRSFILTLPQEQIGYGALPQAGECALLAIEPGRSENIRMNGTYRDKAPGEDGARQLSVKPEEIYFHCSAAFARSRIWSDSRPVSWTGRRSFSCIARYQESPDVVSFVLKPRDNAPLGTIAPGQYVTVTLPKDGNQPPRSRCYSVSASPDSRSLRISVRRIGRAGVSDLLHETLTVGNKILLGAPAGSFVLDSVPRRPVVLVSAGVGITPLLPMLGQLGRETVGRDVWFVHAARDARHHLFKEEVQRIAAYSATRIRLFTAYSRAGDGEVCDYHGRLGAATIASLTWISDADFYICGPNEFMSSLRQGLVALGAAQENIRTEVFEARTGGLAEAFSGDMAGRPACTVEFQRSGKSVTWKPESGSLLDFALANDVEIQYSCRSGECQSCVQRVVSGNADYPMGDEPLLAEGQVLLCQAVPRGKLVLDC